MITLPNIISLLRICLTLLFVIAFLHNKLKSSIMLLTISILTDFLDGFLARTLKQKTKFGSFLDPLADKTLVVAVILVLMFRNYIPWWFFGVVLVREFLVIAGWLITYQQTTILAAKPRFLGKISVCLEMITCACVIINIYVQWNVLNDIIHELFVITSIFVVGSLVDYIYHARKIFQK